MDHNEMRGAAGRVAGHNELIDIRLVHCEAHLHKVPNVAAGLTFDFMDEPTAQYEPGSEFLYVSVNYSVNIFEGPSSISDKGDAPDSEVATIKFTYAGAFHTGVEVEFETEEIEAFARTTGAFGIYPYAREYVADATGRLGLPPLTLGLYKI